MILIGSRAAYLRGVRHREPRDWDFVCTPGQLGNEPGEWEGDKFIRHDPDREYEIANVGSSKILYDLSSQYGDYIGDWMVPDRDLLFTIKCSHRYKKDSPHFWKTLGDYHVMRRMGCTVRPEYREFLAMREKETYTNKTPKLNVSKQAFFTDSYLYDHDSIHRVVALADRPAYENFKKGEVQCDRRLFEACDYQTRLHSVLEESCVLAIERSLVPHPGKLSPEQAWRLAFSKVLTSITSGWFREWAYDNAVEALKAYPTEYYERFLEGVKTGEVLKCK